MREEAMQQGFQNVWMQSNHSHTSSKDKWVSKTGRVCSKANAGK